MEIVSPIVTATSLAFIFAEDVSRFRIRVVWFALLLLSLVTTNFLFNNDFNWVISTTSNLLIAFIMIGLTLLVLKLIYPNKFSSVRKAGGLGDLLMILAFCIQFETLAFIYILLATFILALISHFLLLRIRHGAGNKIPLAGYMALVLLLSLGLSYFQFVNLSSDLFWSKFLMLYE